MTEKVSVIIPTYNRFNYLINTISSIKNQTYKNIEIIVINDRSTQKEYYEYDWKDITIIHLNKNTKEILGYPCAGYVRNIGLKIADGKYIGFCDDDDIWFPNKIDMQINMMKKTGCKMSSTDGLIGNGIYDSSKEYKIYNAENCYNTIQEIFKKKGSNLLDNDYPDIWTLEFLKYHNSIITSSVLIEKEIIYKIGGMNLVKNGEEDYNYWLRALQHTNSIYIKDICFYYDENHGDGRNY
jgi:glycosyltransferase involved in cell wall biosynthesis